MVAAGHSDRQRREHLHSRGAQYRLVAHAGKHEEMGGFDRARAEHDAIGGHGELSARTDRVHAGDASAGDTQSHRAGLGQQGKVRAFQRGQQIRGAGTDPHTVDDVERHGADAVRQRVIVG